MKILRPYLIFALSFFIAACSKESTVAEESQIQNFTLTVAANEGGSVSTTGGTYKKGTEVTITATPNSEFLFDKWSNGSTDNPLKIIITTAMDLTATFEKKNYTLTINIVGEGTINEEVVNTNKVATDYESGSTVKLTPEPSEEWIFVGWTGAVESTESPIEILVDEAKQITATFVPVQYNLMVTSGQGGTVDNVSGQYDAGSQITITATTESDFIFSHWSDDLEENPRTITITSDLEISAMFQDKSQIEDGFYLHIGTIIEGEFYGYDSTFVFEYLNNEAISCGTAYTDLASFPIFKDIGYVPGQPDEALSDVLISRNRINREYLNAGILNSWVLEKIDESEIPNKRTHEEIMALVQGKGFWSDPVYSQIDPLVPESYVRAFLADAERHGLDLSFVDVNQILIEFREEGTAGASHLSCVDDERVHLSYTTAFWKSTSYFDIQNERLTVMCHELGHDILNSGHPSTGDMKQFMNQALGDVGPIVWDDSKPMFSFRRMVDDMFSGVGLDYPCTNGAIDYSSNSTKSSKSTRYSGECFPFKKQDLPIFK